MLEHASLLLHPWARQPVGPDVWTRRVEDGQTGAALGFVRRSGRPDRSWRDWLRGHRLEVFETEDASLLCVIVQPWGWLRAWDVFDADERRVGSVHPPALLDDEGVRRGTLRPESGTVVGPEGDVLAEFEERAGRETLVRFAGPGEGNPFLRMLLLAGVLTLRSGPEDDG